MRGTEEQPGTHPVRNRAAQRQSVEGTAPRRGPSYGCRREGAAPAGTRLRGARPRSAERQRL